MNDEQYIPEAGQMLFGQPWQYVACPRYVVALLGEIDSALRTIMWNRDQEKYESPFDNSGNVDGFTCDVFEVHAYSWDETTSQEFNFRWRDLRVSWYKHLRRGTSINRPTTPEEAVTMFNECMASLETVSENIRTAHRFKDGKETISPEERQRIKAAFQAQFSGIMRVTE